MTAPSTPEEPRRETRTEWRNVYRSKNGSQWVDFGHSTRKGADEDAEYIESAGFAGGSETRIAIEKVETTTTITRLRVEEEK